VLRKRKFQSIIAFDGKVKAPSAAFFRGQGAADKPASPPAPSRDALKTRPRPANPQPVAYAGFILKGQLDFARRLLFG
jgi:hypothetical protein